MIDREKTDSSSDPAARMPKWLFYGLIGKGIFICAIVIAVLWYAGIIG